MTPLKCYQLYVAIKAHFTTKAYDAVKHNCRINATTDSFERRNDKGLFKYLAREFDEPKELVSYFIANLAYGEDYPIPNVEEGRKNLAKWQKNRQSLTKIFTDDLHTIQECNVCYNELIDGDGPAPRLFLLAKNGKINVETLSILDRLDNFTESWKKKYPLFKPEVLRIQKMGSFIKFDHEKFLQLYEEILNEKV